MIGDEGEYQKYKMFIILTLALIFFIGLYSIIEYRYINTPPLNLVANKTTVNVYSNDVVLVTTTEVKSILDENIWYIFGEARYIEISSRLVNSRITTLQEYLKSLP